MEKLFIISDGKPVEIGTVVERATDSMSKFEKSVRLTAKTIADFSVSFSVLINEINVKLVRKIFKNGMRARAKSELIKTIGRDGFSNLSLRRKIELIELFIEENRETVFFNRPNI